MKSIGVIGAGKMGQAIIGGLTGKEFSIRVLSRADVRIWGVTRATSYTDLSGCDAVLLCVKPNDLTEACLGLLNAIQGAGTHPLIVSVAAGKTITFLEHCLPGERVIRAMPNLAAGVRKSVTCFSKGSLATGNDIHMCVQVFNCFGSSIQLNEEVLDAASVLSGSGPAYFFYFTQKLAEGGVAAGLNTQTANMLARKVLEGAAGIAENSQESMEDLIKKVATPSGFTEAAIQTLDSAEVATAITRAVMTAKDRCAKIGGK